MIYLLIKKTSDVDKDFGSLDFFCNTLLDKHAQLQFFYDKYGSNARKNI